jgi:hypothetical protein
MTVEAIARAVPSRRLPYPYKALLAICSDLDETPDRHAYWQIMRFLNTTEDTAIGPGVGLEVGNSIYFDMPPNQFAYWNTDEAGRRMVHALICSGHIDCLHSYGDFATTRDHARRALDELAAHDCRLEVWVDHRTAPTNFGQDIMQGHGDEPSHEAYHADLTVGAGIRYVWRGRVTSMIGQNALPDLGGLFRIGHPLRSSCTVAKEWVKRALARRGSEKYAMHAANEVLRPIRLRDGAIVYEFLRCNPHWGGVSSSDTAAGIGDVLTEVFLRRLIEREGVCVLYTHLGKVREPRTPFGEVAIAAFRRLADGFRRGEILVTTTRRLLGFCRASREVSFTASREGKDLRIDLDTTTRGPLSDGGPGACDLDGLTFYVRESDSVRVTLNGREMTDIVHNSPDHTGSRSVSLPWRRLEFPEL